jgi:hypothetical protein
MNRRILVIAAGITLLSVGIRPLGAAEPPSKAIYLYFVQGQPAGKAEIQTTLEGGAYVVTSTSEIDFVDFNQTLTCRTDFAKESRRPTLFRYDGFRNDVKMSGTVRIGNGSAEGKLESGGTPYSGRVAWNDPTYLFQDYVPDHLMMMARDLLALEKESSTFTVLFPSNMVLLPAIASNESEIELPVRPKPVVCRKFGIGFQNAAPFFVYVDSKQGIPIYVDFPSVQTEVFLQGTFGDHPATKYVAPPQPAGP